MERMNRTQILKRIEDQQTAVLNFIIQYKSAHGGNSPSTREIAQAVGLSSTSRVDVRIDELEAAGRLQRLGDKYQVRLLDVPGYSWRKVDVEAVTE